MEWCKQKRKNELFHEIPNLQKHCLEKSLINLHSSKSHIDNILNNNKKSNMLTFRKRQQQKILFYQKNDAKI